MAFDGDKFCLFVESNTGADPSKIVLGAVVGALLVIALAGLLYFLHKASNFSNCFLPTLRKHLDS